MIPKTAYVLALFWGTANRGNGAANGLSVQKQARFSHLLPIEVKKLNSKAASQSPGLGVLVWDSIHLMNSTTNFS